MTANPTIVRGMPEDEYHGHPNLSKSQAAKLLPPSTPEKFRWALDNPEHSDAFDFGRAAHAYVLEGRTDIVVIHADDWRTKGAREEADAVRAAGRTPLLAKDWQTVLDMARALETHPDAGPLLRAVKPDDIEVSLFWHDDEFDVPRRCRFDAIIGGVGIDYKTCQSAAPDDFARSAMRYRYPMQAAWYLQGAAALYPKLSMDRFVFVAQEKAPPYAVAVYELDVDSLEIGQRDVSEALTIYRRCTEADEWPGYGGTEGGPQWLRLPEWKIRQEGLA